jgi:LysM repeat protein
MSRKLYTYLVIVILLSAVSLLSFAVTSAQEVVIDPANCAPVQPDGWVVYSIQEGDTLASLALRTGSTVQELQRANCIANPRRIVAGHRLFVPTQPDEPDFGARCRAAGFTAQECRRIWNSLRDEQDVAERCRLAGLTTEECRRLWNAGQDDDNAAERCRLAGLTAEQCRRLFDAQGDDPAPERPADQTRDTTGSDRDTTDETQPRNGRGE